ncbi:MAG: hypothetical protein ACI8PZ_001314 [Myxococcota bacterium]|jgi:hypothetical protein
MVVRLETTAKPGCRCPYGRSPVAEPLDIRIVGLDDLPDQGPDPVHDAAVVSAVGLHAAGRQLAAFLHADGVVHVFAQSGGWVGPVATGEADPVTGELDWHAGGESDWVDMPMGLGWTEDLSVAVEALAEAWAAG